MSDLTDAKQFRNCYSDAVRKSLTHSPERPCGRPQIHPGHKHMANRATWYCPGVPAAPLPAEES